MTAPIEVDRAEFPRRYDEDGYAWIDFPDDLPFDGGTCATEGCDNTVGMYLWESDDGRQAGEVWATTFRTEDGQYICEDCADWLSERVPHDP